MKKSEGIPNRNNPEIFLTVDDISEILRVSTQTAYKIIRHLNKDLLSQGYLIVPGRVSRSYFNKKYYNGSQHFEK